MAYHHAIPTRHTEHHIILVGTDAAGHHLVVEDDAAPRSFPDRQAAIAFAQRERDSLGNAVVLITPFQL